jgi:hypothetical protein
VTDAQQEVARKKEISGIGVRNIGEPLRFSNVEDLAGFSAGPGKGGGTIKVWTSIKTHK